VSKAVSPTAVAVRPAAVAVQTAAVAVVLALIGLMVATVDGAAASSSCARTMTISGPTNGHLVLTPNPAKVQLGGCVAFANATNAKVSLAVAGKPKYSTVLAKGDTTSSSASYAPDALGKDVVAAASKAVLIIPVTGSASITVTPAPKVSPTASGSPTPSGKRTGTPSVSPDVAPSPKHPKKTATPKPTGIKLPPLPPLPSTGATGVPIGTNPLVAPGPTSASASPVTVTGSQSPVAAMIAGPLEPPDNDSRGLPEAVGVIVVLGLAAGWGRVLLAQPRPVDDRSRGDHRL
jgi:hypothetical protein